MDDYLYVAIRNIKYGHYLLAQRIIRREKAIRSEGESIWQLNCYIIYSSNFGAHRLLMQEHLSFTTIEHCTHTREKVGRSDQLAS
jgi:hypothetical protein